MLPSKDSTIASDFYQSDDQKYFLIEMDFHLRQAEYHFKEASDHLEKFKKHQKELMELPYVHQ